MITRRGFITGLMAGAMALGCLGLAACGGSPTGQAAAPNVQGPLWDNPGVYTYTNDDPDCPLQVVKITVGQDAKLKMDDFATGHAYRQTKRYISITPSENPALFEGSEDDTRPREYELEMGDATRWTSEVDEGEIMYHTNLDFNVTREDGSSRNVKMYINGVLNNPAEETDFTQITLDTAVFIAQAVHIEDHYPVIESMAYNGVTVDTRITEITEPLHFTLTNYEVAQ